MAKKTKKRGGWTPNQRKRYEATLAARKRGQRKQLVASPTVAPSASTAFQAVGAMIVPTAKGPHPKTLMLLDAGNLVPYVLKSVPAYVKK